MYQAICIVPLSLYLYMSVVGLGLGLKTVVALPLAYCRHGTMTL